MLIVIQLINKFSVMKPLSQSCLLFISLVMYSQLQGLGHGRKHL